jgi:hypothetical protein
VEKQVKQRMSLHLLPVMMKMVMEKAVKVTKGGAQMKGLIKVAKGTGKVVLALLVGVFMPILIWVALGVALNKKLRGEVIQQTEVKTIGEILNRANQTIKR